MLTEFHYEFQVIIVLRYYSYQKQTSERCDSQLSLFLEHVDLLAQKKIDLPIAVLGFLVISQMLRLLQQSGMLIHVNLMHCLTYMYIFENGLQILKNSLNFIANDFPELEDTLLFSPFMRQLDDIIGWNIFFCIFEHIKPFTCRFMDPYYSSIAKLCRTSLGKELLKRVSLKDNIAFESCLLELLIYWILECSLLVHNTCFQNSLRDPYLVESYRKCAIH